MAERIFIFRQGSTELVLPVTPDNYKVDKGVNVEVVNIHQLGDAVFLGYGTLATIKIHCMFPARNYPFAYDADPDWYIQQFERWVKGKKRLRFIVGDTAVNIPVIIENFSYGEQDGTNDVYADLVLREYRKLQAVQTAAVPADSTPREAPEAPAASSQSYTIKAGDTLSAICRAHYGDGSAAVYNKVAAHNGIANPHLIYAGRTINLPTPLT